MGHLSFLFMIIEYCKYSHAGLLQALDREIPFHKGRNETEKIIEIQRVSFNFYFFSTLILSAAIFVIALLLYLFGFNRPYMSGVIFIPGLLLSYMFVTYYRVILRARHQFRLLSYLNLLSAWIEVIACVGLVWIWGLPGVLIGLTLSSLFGGIYLWRKSQIRLPISPKWIQWTELKRLLKIGFPLILYDLVRMVFLSVDTIMIIAFLGYTQLGIYSVATMAFNFLMPLPRSIYNVITPRFYEAFGRSNDIQGIRKYLIEPTIIVGYLFSILIGSAIIFLIPLIYHMLSQYREGIHALIILMISPFFYSLIFMWCSFLIAMYKQMKMVYFNLIAIVISIGLNLFFVKGLHWGITGVAIGTSIVYALLSTLFITYVYSFYTVKIGAHFKLLFQLYFPAFWVGGVLWILARFSPFSHVSLISDLLHAGGLAALFFACCLPLAIYIGYRTQLFGTLLRIFWPRIENEASTQN